MIIVVIEPDEYMASSIKEQLQKDDHKVYIAGNGISGIESVRSRNAELIIMERNLPDSDGIEICRRIYTERKAPIIVISDIHTREDKILCIGFGAYEYMERPVRPIDILYRVRKVVDSLTEKKARDEEKKLHYSGKLTINDGEKRAYIQGKPIDLTEKEYELLRFFLTHRERIYSGEEIYENVWKEPAYNDTGCVTTYISRIRNKLLKYDLRPIKTVRGKGYITNED